VHEVWHFKEQSNTFFRQHMDTFIKLKQEASGYPANIDAVNDPEAVDRYIDDFLRKENIQLDPTNISENLALRTVMKLFLNSLWGKFLQRSDLKVIKHCVNAEQLFELINDNSVTIVSVDFPSQDMAVVTLKDHPDFVRAIDYINVVVAAFTTSWGRLRLFKLIQSVGSDRILYCDTDSIAFISRMGDSNPECNNLIGGLTDEIQKKHGQGAFIKTWIGVAPKMYTYEVVSINDTDGKERLLETCLKAKGISMGCHIRETINFNTFKSMASQYYEWFKNITPYDELINEEHEVIRQRLGNMHLYMTSPPKPQVITFPKFVIRRNCTIVTEIQQKSIKCIFDKRRLLVSSAEQFPVTIESVPLSYH